MNAEYLSNYADVEWAGTVYYTRQIIRFATAQFMLHSSTHNREKEVFKP
jgi:hypothetical protein